MQRGSFTFRNPAKDLSMRALIERLTVEVSPSHKGRLKEAARMRHTAKCRVWKTHVANLKPADIAAWRDQRLKEVTASTVLREIGDLALVKNHAMKEWGLVLPSNPFKSVKRPKVSNARQRRLTLADPNVKLSKSEEEILLAACSPNPSVLGRCRVQWLKPMVQLAIETAMRRGELLRLEWQHVDLNTSVVFCQTRKMVNPVMYLCRPRRLKSFDPSIKASVRGFSMFQRMHSSWHGNEPSSARGLKTCISAICCMRRRHG